MPVIGQPSPILHYQNLRIWKVHLLLIGNSTQGLTSDEKNKACHHFLHSKSPHTNSFSNGGLTIHSLFLTSFTILSSSPWNCARSSMEKTTYTSSFLDLGW